MVSAISRLGQRAPLASRLGHILALRPDLKAACSASAKSKTSPATVSDTLMTVLLTTVIDQPGERGGSGAGGRTGGKGGAPGGGGSDGDEGSEGGGSAGGRRAGSEEGESSSSELDSFCARVTCSLKVSSTVLTGRHSLLPVTRQASLSAWVMRYVSSIGGTRSSVVTSMLILASSPPLTPTML